jgi:hypothetical protein
MFNINHIRNKMADRITDGTLLNVNDIMYTSPKATPQGAKSVNILNKRTKTGLTLSTPLMLTWGASEFVDQATGQGDGKFTMSLQFPGKEYENEDSNAFLKNMKDLEDKIKADALINSKEWFGKVHKNADVVEALWTPMLKYSKDKATGEYDYSRSPTLRIKIQQWESVFKCEIYSEDGDKLFPSSTSQVTPLDYLKKGSNIMCLIQFAGIWFVNGKFSASWKLVQAVVQKPKATLQGQCFIKMKTQDKEKIKNQQVIEDDDNIVSTIVDDSDNEEELLELVEQLSEKVKELPTLPPPEVVVAAATVFEEPKKAPVKKLMKKKADA